MLRELENIDEEADEEDLPFVRIHDEKLAREFGLDSILPVLVYFEKQIPSVYHGIYFYEIDVLFFIQNS